VPIDTAPRDNLDGSYTWELPPGTPPEATLLLAVRGEVFTDRTLASIPSVAGDNPHELGLCAGAWLWGQALRLDDSFAFGLRATRRIDPRWSAEAWLGASRTRRAGDDGVVLDGGLDALRHFGPPARRLRPFLAVGFGVTSSRGFADDTTTAGVDWGAGVTLRLAGSWRGRADVRDHVWGDLFRAGRTHNWRLTLGASVGVP
jgi:Outer membrane protein beta-barrel domain